MRILGIDPGLQCTGFGVIDVDGPRLHYVASGTITTSPRDGALLPGRLKVLFDGITEVVGRYQPQVAACEIVFVNVNPQATLLLGQARGCCLTALVANGLPVAEYTALQLKKAVVGYGRADKAQMQEMVKRAAAAPTTAIVQGLLRMSEPGGGFLRTNAPAEQRWYSRDIAAMGRALQLPQTAPFFIDAGLPPAPGSSANSATDTRWPRAGMTVVRFSNSHLVYALTWYGLALMVAGAGWYVARYERRLRDARSAQPAASPLP